MRDPKKIWLLLFGLVSAAELVSLFLNLGSVQNVTKPLLMLTLGMYFFVSSRGFPAWRNLVFGALAFSWFGDVFLMYENGFIAGLGSFLVAHLFYIAVYQKTGASTGTLRPVDGVKFVLVGVALIWVLLPGLGSLLIPVVIYAFVLLGMAVWAHKRRNSTSDVSFTLVALGAVLFVVSDSLIAVNKFAFTLPYEDVLVMSTYIAAQYLIIEGLIRHQAD